MYADAPIVADPSAFEPSMQSREDEKLLVKFFLHPQQDPTASAEAGRAIFKDVEFIDIKVPGQRGGVVRPARKNDIERFPRHYAAFKQRMEMPVSGTPLAEWPLLSRSVVEELAFINIKTIEDLAGMSDTHTGKMMGLANWKRQAQEWLEAASDDSEVTAAVAKLEQAEATIAHLTKRLEALEAKEADLHNPELDADDGGTDTPTRRRQRRSKQE